MCPPMRAWQGEAPSIAACHCGSIISFPGNIMPCSPILPRRPAAVCNASCHNPSSAAHPSPAQVCTSVIAHDPYPHQASLSASICLHQLADCNDDSPPAVALPDSCRTSLWQDLQSLNRNSFGTTLHSAVHLPTDVCVCGSAHRNVCYCFKASGVALVAGPSQP